MKRIVRPTSSSSKPAVVSATAALAALSVALLLTMPAVTATGQSFRGASESDATRAALAQLRESLNEAARALAGVQVRNVGQPAAATDCPTLRDTLAGEPLRARPLAGDGVVFSPPAPLRDALLNLPPPTR